MITNEQRMRVLKQADSTTAEVYSSLETAKKLASVTKKYGLPEGGKHIDVIGDIILGFYKKEQLQELLVETAQVSHEVAGQVADDLSEFLENIPNTEKVTAVNRAQNISKIPTEQTEARDETPPRPITKEEVGAYVSPRRTMQDDIAAVKGGSSESQPKPRNEPAPQTGADPQRSERGPEERGEAETSTGTNTRANSKTIAYIPQHETPRNDDKTT